MANKSVMKRNKANNMSTTKTQANVVAAVDKHIDPAKLTNLACKRMEIEVERISEQAANASAIAKGYARELEQLDKDIRDLDAAIEMCKNSTKYSKEERIADIQDIVQQKVMLQQRREIVASMYMEAAENQAGMSRVRNELINQYDKMENESALIKSKVETAKAKKVFGKFGAFIGRGTVAMGLFNQAHKKADYMLDAANERELMDKQINNPTLLIKEKYGSTDVRVQEEMKKIISEM